MGLSTPLYVDAPICERSGKYVLSKSMAKSEAKRRMKRRRVGVNLTAFRCPDCGGWHIGQPWAMRSARP